LKNSKEWIKLLPTANGENCKGKNSPEIENISSNWIMYKSTGSKALPNLESSIGKITKLNSKIFYALHPCLIAPTS
jgi:hypothetical protein